MTDEFFEQAQREHEEICTDPYVCIDEEKGCLLSVKEEAERRRSEAYWSEQKSAIKETNS